jgi:hypothetical protein
MSVITFDTAIESPATATDMPVTRPRVWRVGLVAGLGAAAATTATAVVADAAGVSLAISGEQIPPAGFAQLTFMCALLGVALAAVFARRSSRPRTTFVRTTVALTVLSLLPDVVVDADSATRLVLGLTHIVAAAIVIPAISRSLRD